MSADAFEHITGKYWGDDLTTEVLYRHALEQRETGLLGAYLEELGVESSTIDKAVIVKMSPVDERLGQSILHLHLVQVDPVNGAIVPDTEVYAGIAYMYDEDGPVLQDTPDGFWPAPKRQTILRQAAQLMALDISIPDTYE